MVLASTPGPSVRVIAAAVAMSLLMGGPVAALAWYAEHEVTFERRSHRDDVLIERFHEVSAVLAQHLRDARRWVDGVCARFPSGLSYSGPEQAVAVMEGADPSDDFAHVWLVRATPTERVVLWHDGRPEYADLLDTDDLVLSLGLDTEHARVRPPVVGVGPPSEGLRVVSCMGREREVAELGVVAVVSPPTSLTYGGGEVALTDRDSLPPAGRQMIFVEDAIGLHGEPVPSFAVFAEGPASWIWSRMLMPFAGVVALVGALLGGIAAMIASRRRARATR